MDPLTGAGPLAAQQRVAEIQGLLAALTPERALAPSATFSVALTAARSGRGAAPSPGTNDAIAPLGSAPRLIGRPYQGTHTLGNWQSDNAIDLAAPVGTPVYAVADGTIGSRIGPLASTSSRFAGERLTLEGREDSYYYAHLSRLAVTAGQSVRRGQLLGWSGSANGVAHLHLGVRRGDPLRFAPAAT